MTQESSQEKILQLVQHDLGLFLLEMKKLGQERDIPNISWDTALFLIEKLRGRNIRNILEIGPANGFSTMMLALACPEAEIISIEFSRHAFEELRHNIQAFNNLKNLNETPFLKGDVRQSGQGDLLCTNPAVVWNFTEISYRPDLTEKAKELRKNMTGPEKKIWYTALKKDTFKGLRFLRQKPLLEYIVDFYCHELGLVIELNGFSHHDNEEYDQRRFKNLEKHGLTVVQFSNDEVLFSFDDVCDRLEKIIESLQNKSSPLRKAQGTSFKKEVSVYPANFPPKVTSDISQENIGQFILYYGDAREILPAFEQGVSELICKHPKNIIRNIPAKKFDCIFIDGAFRMTREFFDLSRPLLHSDGIIILDDAIKYRWKMGGFHEYLEKRGIPYSLVQTDPDDGVMVIE